MFFLILALLFCLQFLGLQADLDLIFTDYEISYYNPAYFKDAETNVWDNHIFVNLTIIDFFPPNTEIRGQMFGSTMGEYIVPIGIDVSLLFCDFYTEPIFLAAALKQFNTSLDQCPPKPGNYIMEDYTFDLETFPDTFPPNHYLLKTTIKAPEVLLLIIDCYVREDFILISYIDLFINNNSKMFNNH